MIDEFLLFLFILLVLVCKAGVDTNAPVFRVIAIMSSGRKLKDAGVCLMYKMRPSFRIPM